MGRVRVAIYGAGMGGLSAAHELAKFPDRFQVDVFEPADRVGGKAASQFVCGTSSHGRRDLPGEHGFRFFPAFYEHLDLTMSEIPAADGRSVLANLVGSEQFAVARTYGRPAVAGRRIGMGLETVPSAMDALSTWFAQDGLDLSANDLGNFVLAMTKFLTSSKRRRVADYDPMSWYEFTKSHIELFSDNYRTLVSTLPRMMVAMDGRRGSAYTIGKVGAQLFFLDAARQSKGLDRVLDGPTDDRWLTPWHRHLVRSGVRFHFGTGVEHLELRETPTGAEIEWARLGDGRVIHADIHVCAMPVERLCSLIHDDVAAACPQLSAVRSNLATCTDWMVGAQYFLRRDVPVCEGHVIYPDSPWALTSISQRQFWERSGVCLGDRYGRGLLKGVLSVDISNWGAVAPRLGRSARQCTREEILEEAFLQLTEGLNTLGHKVLGRNDVIASHLDSNIEFDCDTNRVGSNRTPLFVHHPGTFKHRPSAGTSIANLFLAADFVATDTNLASMEGANEAARRAVRRLAASVGAHRVRPMVRPMPEPAVFAPFKQMDRWLVTQGVDVGHAFEATRSGLAEIVAGAHLSNVVSISRLAHCLGPARRARTRPAESMQRVVKEALDGAQRIVSRRRVFGASDETQPSKLPSQVPPAA